MLGRQKSTYLHPLQAHSLHLPFGLLLGHLVRRFDGYPANIVFFCNQVQSSVYSIQDLQSNLYASYPKSLIAYKAALTSGGGAVQIVRYASTMGSHFNQVVSSCFNRHGNQFARC